MKKLFLIILLVLSASCAHKPTQPNQSPEAVENALWIQAGLNRADLNLDELMNFRRFIEESCKYDCTYDKPRVLSRIDFMMSSSDSK